MQKRRKIHVYHVIACKKKCKKFTPKKHPHFNMLMSDHIDYPTCTLMADHFKKWDNKTFVCCFSGIGLLKLPLAPWHLSDQKEVDRY